MIGAGAINVWYIHNIVVMRGGRNCASVGYRSSSVFVRCAVYICQRQPCFNTASFALGIIALKLGQDCGACMAR